MTEQNVGCEPRGVAANAPEPAKSRKPFVRPAVQDLGGLTTLTLLGGSL